MDRRSIERELESPEAARSLLEVFERGRPRPSRSVTTAHVVEVSTYDQLVGGIVTFFNSTEHTLLRTVLGEGSSWIIGVPSAVRNAVESVGPARLGKLIWVNLPYHMRSWSLRMVQRRVAEQVLGVDTTKELMDGVDEDDDYSCVKMEERGILEDVSNRIFEELSRMGRFLLVVQNWRETDSPELENMGIPLPGKRSQSKILLWDPVFREEEQNLLYVGDPTTNTWLSLNRPAMEDRLAYVYREAVDLAGVVNSGDGGLTTAVTPQHVLDFLFFHVMHMLGDTQFLFNQRPFIIQSWVHSGLICGTGGRGAVPTHTAEALLEELAHRRSVVCLYDDDEDIEWLRVSPDMASLMMVIQVDPHITQGYQDFRPAKILLLTDEVDKNIGNLEELENVQTAWVLSKCIHELMYARLCNLRSLILAREDPPTGIPGDFFSCMDCLRILHFHNLTASSLPTSLFGLPNLRMLFIKDCESLEALLIPGAPPPPTTRALHGLLILHVFDSSIRIFPDPAFAHMHSLEELIVNDCSDLNIVHDNLSYFRNMQTLQVLDLSSNSLIDSLPASLLIEAPNLKRLLLLNCFRLKTLTPHLFSHSALEELDLRGCRALQVEEIVFKTPMLKIFRLSKSTAIRRLSFRGCNKLEVVDLFDLKWLEVLDLSGTAIKELSPKIFQSLHLKSLVIFGATNLRAFPWREMEHLPLELMLDQHTVEACNYINANVEIKWQQYGGRGVQMHVRDGRFFRMLCDPEKGNYTELETFFTTQFYINISPSLKESQREVNQVNFTRKGRNVYRGIQMMQPNILSKPSQHSRHIKIQGSHPSPADIHGLLKSTLSLSVTNQHTYRSLSELLPIGSVVEHCHVEHCHGMESIFNCSADSCMLEFLESLWASQLSTVVALAVEKGSSRFNWSQGFKNLKHVHLQSCPKLKYVFPPGARWGLQSLEVLEISFCTNLKEIFTSPSQESQQAMMPSSSTAHAFAPHLRTLHLLQLPNLVSICHNADSHWPALESFQVRGCWRLKKLPFLSSALPTKQTLMIDGEPVWWNRVVQGGDIIVKHEFHFSGANLPLPMPKQ